MDEIEKFLGDICDYAQKQLDGDDVLAINITTRTSSGMPQRIFRQMTGIEDLMIAVTFMQMPHEMDEAGNS